MDELTARGFDVDYRSHARAILETDFPEALSELAAVIGEIQIPIAEIVGSGGGEAKATQRLRNALTAIGWRKTTFTIEKIINGVRRESISHEIDHVRRFDNGTAIALEIEWNNKDPFFDRDLENFKRLHAEGAISVGVIVTRGRSLQEELRHLVLRFAQQNQIEDFEKLLRLGVKPTDRQKAYIQERIIRSGNTLSAAWSEHFVSDKFGAATTHWRKLQDRIARGVGNPCPLLLVGLPASVVTFE